MKLWKLDTQSRWHKKSKLITRYVHIHCKTLLKSAIRTPVSSYFIHNTHPGASWNRNSCCLLDGLDKKNWIHRSTYSLEVFQCSLKPKISRSFLRTYTFVNACPSDASFKKAWATVTAKHTVMFPKRFITTDLATNCLGERSTYNKGDWYWRLRSWLNIQISFI